MFSATVRLGENGKVLINHLDAAVDGVHGLHFLYLFSIDPDGTLIGVMNTGDRLDQRGFSAAVLAGQAVDLAFSDLQVYSFECVYAAERFLDAFQFQKDLQSSAACPPFFPI